MDFEDIGAYCHYDLCGQHSYLPFECTGCKHQFCKLHIDFLSHKCPHHTLYTSKDDSTKHTSHTLTYNTCAYSKCNKQTPITILCRYCDQLFCVKHRYIDDHKCANDLNDKTKFDADGYANIDELKLDQESDNYNNDINFNYTRQSSDDIHYQSITKMQSLPKTESVKIKSKYNYAKSRDEVDMEVIDTHKFNELRSLGYNDKQIYNAWYYLKMENPTMTPQNDTFLNKMIDVLSLQQIGYNQIHEYDDQFYNHDNEQKINSNHKHKKNINTSEASTFNMQRVCESLHQEIAVFSMKKKQHKIDTFIKLICNTTNKQRQQIKFHYKQRYLVNLEHYINMNFKGSIFKRMLLYSMQSEIEQNEYILRIAIKKEKDINCITQVLCILDSDQISELVAFHDKGIFRKSLKSQINKLTANDLTLRLFLLNIINGLREKSSIAVTLETNQRNLLAKDISFLLHVLTKMNWSQLEKVRFINIFSTKSFEYLYLLCQTFESSTDMPLIDACDNALGSQNGIGYAIHNIVAYLTNKNEYYVNLLNRTTTNSGHKYVLFWRIIMDRIDGNLNQILKCLYQSDVYRYNLKQFINVTLYQQDTNAANLIKKLCGLN